MYNRLFTKILDSSIWLEPSTTRIVWVTLLAAMDEDGYAHFSATENLAARARVSLKDTQKAIDCFLAPDVNSENPENEGRRIERVPGGFLVLNALEYREKFNREIMREKTRLRVAEYREKKKGNKKVVTRVLPIVTPASASVRTSENASASAFDLFWKAYPKKKAKGDAQKAWGKLDVALAIILRAIEQQKRSREWLREDGRYVPYPATWLNARRWEDESGEAQPRERKSVFDEI